MRIWAPQLQLVNSDVAEWHARSVTAFFERVFIAALE